MYPIRLPEKRQHVRYRLKDNLFAAVQGDLFNNPANIVDLSDKGLGFYAVCKEHKLTGKFIVFDLMSDMNRPLLRSLSGRVVFSGLKNQKKDDPIDAPQRYGVQFVNLSTLDKRLLDKITKKYALPE